MNIQEQLYKGANIQPSSYTAVKVTDLFWFFPNNHTNYLSNSRTATDVNYAENPSNESPDTA